MILYYIGPGKKGTGDWCFSDRFISFREIMNLYMNNEHFKGKIIYLVSDCSYSGNWVRGLGIIDEQGVGPCGHLAKEKGILVKVFTSCLCDEIPAELSFSILTVQNDKNTGQVSYKIDIRSDKIYNGQHPSGIDFTRVRCKNKINQPCTMAPGSIWERWSTQRRTMSAGGKEKGRPAWYYLLLVDDEETIRMYKEETTGENAGKNS